MITLLIDWSKVPPKRKIILSRIRTKKKTKIAVKNKNLIINRLLERKYKIRK